VAPKQTATDRILRELRAFGLAYPGAHTKSPWPGHLDLAVKDKTFAYLSLEGEPLRISCKLPRTSSVALLLPFCEPAGYGLGKSGWVAANFEHDSPDIEMLKAWIDESYRVQAPKALVKQLTFPPLTGETPPKNTAKKPATRSKSKPTARSKARR
jgi:predicted DNA-binding protein (MmcQ/YjbR family)